MNEKRLTDAIILRNLRTMMRTHDASGMTVADLLEEFTARAREKRGKGNGEGK